MGEWLPYTPGQRRRFCDNRYGYRPTNDWNEGDLPAPWAEGDVVRVPEGAVALERMRGMGPGVYVVVYATSIDEGDGWYFRLWNGDHNSRSDRLHVAYEERCESCEDMDWLAGCELVDTADPDGLAERRRILTAGLFRMVEEPCYSCNGTGAQRRRAAAGEGNTDG